MGETYRRSVKIFIGGLSFETTDEALKRYFEQFGPVADAIVMKDAVSRRSRGFGFITYMNSASVDAALSVKQHIVDNRRVEAKRAVPRSEVPPKVEPQQQLAQSPSIQSQNSWDTPFAMESYALRGVTPEGRTRSNSTVSASSMGGLITLDGVPMATKIFVGGLHYETRDASLQAYFEQFGPVQTAEVMFNRETHKSRGFGFVVFESEESANAVLQSSHHTVNGKVVEVKRAVPRAQSSTGGSNPSSPAMMGYPPSPSALGPGMGGGPMIKPTAAAAAAAAVAAAAGAKRPQRPRPPRDTMVGPNNGAVPGTPPQRPRYPPTTSYAAALRFGAGRQQQHQQHTGGMPQHGGGGGGGKPPQHHGHMQAREEIASFRLHGSHSSFLPPSAAARAEAAAAHAFVQELKAWDVENPGQGLSFEEPLDYYSEQPQPQPQQQQQQQQQLQRGPSMEFNTRAETSGAGGSNDGSYGTGAAGSGAWPGPGTGQPSAQRAAWAQHGQASSTIRQQQQQQQQQQAHRPPGDATRLLAHNSRVEDVSPRHSENFSTFSHHEDGTAAACPDGIDTHTHLSISTGAAQNGDGGYHNGHGQQQQQQQQQSAAALNEAPNGKMMSPGEAGGTPALMGSSPLLGSNGLLETAFADLKLDGPNPNQNGDGPSMLSGIGGGGPPSASSEALPYGRAGGGTAVDGGGGSEGLAASSVWRADAFGSALGVSVPRTVDEIGSMPMSERKDIMGGGGLGERFMGPLGTTGAGGGTTHVNMGWS
ncbi:unnamed protein product [Ectocarpus sp. 6 AP-2014]